MIHKLTDITVLLRKAQVPHSCLAQHPGGERSSAFCPAFPEVATRRPGLGRTHLRDQRACVRYPEDGPIGGDRKTRTTRLRPGTASLTASIIHRNRTKSVLHFEESKKQSEKGKSVPLEFGSEAVIIWPGGGSRDPEVSIARNMH